MRHLLFITVLISSLTLIHAYAPTASAACINWDGPQCDQTACSCTTPGCNGSKTCSGIDDDSGRGCAVSFACNVPVTNDSCDCEGRVGNFTYNKVSCGQGVQCIGKLGANGSTRTCHFCATSDTAPAPT